MKTFENKKEILMSNGKETDVYYRVLCIMALRTPRDPRLGWTSQDVLARTKVLEALKNDGDLITETKPVELPSYELDDAHIRTIKQSVNEMHWPSLEKGIANFIEYITTL